MKLILLFIVAILLLNHPAIGQTPIRDFNPQKVGQKCIRKFISKQQKYGITCFEDFTPSVVSTTDTTEFDSNVHVFYSGHPLNETWEAYLKGHPSQIWQGRTVSCGMVYDPTNQQIIYTDNLFTGLKAGQLFFIEMKIFGGLIHFPVSFMVTGVDETRHEIRFSYVSSGSSKGAQVIRLIRSGNNTQIIHSSIHQTMNKLRDRTLYPIYHQKAIRQVHHNVKKQILQSPL